MKQTSAGGYSELELCNPNIEDLGVDQTHPFACVILPDMQSKSTSTESGLSAKPLELRCIKASWICRSGLSTW